MSYRFRRDINAGDKTLTFQFASGDEFTLGLEEGDTVLSLKKFVWREKLGDLRAGYGRMRVVFMKEDEHVVLGDNVRLDEDITMQNGAKENISDGKISIFVRDVDIVNFSGIGDAEDKDLSGEDLSGKGLTFPGANLSGTDLREPNLSGLNLNGKIFPSPILPTLIYQDE
jgi:hypothetical protein